MVYHGLGTGKTATAISLAEGLSSQMKINTLLPASLRIEFIKEVQKWGQNELNKESLWVHYPIQVLIEKNMMKDIQKKYSLDQKTITSIITHTQNTLKKNIINSNEDDIDEKIDIMKQTVKKLKGVWLPEKTGKKIKDFSSYEQECILQQINLLIEKKYNFIHYNPFPNFNTTDSIGYEKADDEEDEDKWLKPEESLKMNTHNQKMVVNFEKKLKYNIKKFNINSPFYKEVIIIDEVHNFIRSILNNRPSARIMYNWIINAVDVKLVFLSGTPVINKPSEIAILYNMLKGMIHVYSFTVKTNMNVEDVTKKLNDIYYNKPSPIELLFVENIKGKLILSFIQESSGFESLYNKEDNVVYTIQDNDASFDEFINIIYEGLHSIFKKDSIIPSQETFRKLNKKDLLIIQRGKTKIYDEELDIVFNKKQTLFSINENDKIIDMTNNDNFMEYFFESTLKIPLKKRILLKRMLMGLTSYYPIDRSSIVDMPIVTNPTINHPMYEEYSMVKTMNIVPCMMSQMQFEKYSEVWAAEKSLDMFRRMSGRNIYNEDDPYHYQMRTRQSCNMIYQNDDFRLRKKDDQQSDIIKQNIYDNILKENLLHIDKDLQILSPKMYQIMHHISKYVRNDKPTGKILFYSDFRADAGSEAFELVLKSNGYEKFNPMQPQSNKAKRYTFITGSESNEEKRISKIFFNDENNKDKINKYGEYIQIMIITSSGAEGISLGGVRQVHILEPYWNYARINQVFGRAIRIGSHRDLDKQNKNVEQYLYLSFIPSGNTIETVYKNIKDLNTWNIPQFADENIKNELLKSSNKIYKELIDSIIKINNDSDSKSADQYLFDIMEKKYTISEEINNIIKESSLDCIPHTKDDPYLNDKCIRFSDKLINEIAYFPGIGLKTLENIDIMQLKSTKIFFIKPNIYVISAIEKHNKKNIFIYYQINTDEKNIDIRYLRDHGTRLCDVNVDEKIILKYVDVNHPFNDRLGKEFSVFQEIYQLTDDIIQNYIHADKFPSLDKIIVKTYANGYKLKYNVNDTFYYINQDIISNDKSILKIHAYNEYQNNNYNIFNIPTLVIYKGKIYLNQ